MAFYFGEKKADALMSKINLRDISFRARQWDHAVKGLLKCSASFKEYGNDIRKFQKKTVNYIVYHS